MGSSTLKKRLLIGGVIAALLMIGSGLYFAVSTWGSVNRVSIERPAAESSGGVVAQPDEESEGDDQDPADVIDEGLQVVLLVGSDSREDLEVDSGFGDFDGNRADVVMVVFKDGSKTALLSLPRDLLVEDACTGSETRLGDMLEGCETMNGPSLLTVTVESLTGQGIDHFAMVDFAGFQEAVDAIGGYEICVERPVRDQLANLELDAGCTHASGAQTLAWLRSRHTQELTENGWRTMPGVNDLVRNARQRAFLTDMMVRLSDLTNPQDIASAARSVAPFVTVDSELGIVQAINLAMTLRGLESGSIVELDVPVTDHTTAAGAAVLLPSVPVVDIVAEFLSTTATQAVVVFGIAS